jgi:ubiquinone/menaquinone biosynthesis C-methylase UbiE
MTTYTSMDDLKSAVQDYWDREPCDTRYARSVERLSWFREIESSRYDSEPNILELAQFEKAKGLDVLEIGVGAGIDFSQWVRVGASAVGTDLTGQALALTKEYLDLQQIDPRSYRLLRADAEQLQFPDESFDIVYAYGVLHHTPNTVAAFREAIRVLRKGGRLKCMIYHSPSWTAINLWLYHGLLKLRPWKSLKKIMFEKLESPGTKAYSVSEARELLRQAGCPQCKITLFLGTGDLMDLKLGRKYDNNVVVRMAQKLYPRKLVKMLDGKQARLGIFMHIETIK